MMITSAPLAPSDHLPLCGDVADDQPLNYVEKRLECKR